MRLAVLTDQANGREGREALTYDDEWVRDRLARRMYLAYCAENNRQPHRKQYAPKWARQYADIALDALGYDDAVFTALDPAEDPRVVVS